MIDLADALIRDEGLKLKLYHDSVGIPTIGVGRNLLVGISREEALVLLDNDIHRVQDELQRALPVYLSLSPERRQVLENMCFNLGLTGLLKFKATLSALEAGDYERAALYMMSSRWAQQVGLRAQRLAEIMRSTPV